MKGEEMIKKIFCEANTEGYYDYLDEKEKKNTKSFIEFYHRAACCPEEYVISIDVASPYSKDQCCVIKYNYQEYLKGNIVVEEIKYF
jgi:hypothetical protein